MAAAGATTRTGSFKRGSWWTKVHGKANRVADNFFYRLGYWVAGHPKRTLSISLALVVACCFGFANFEIRNGGECCGLWKS